MHDQTVNEDHLEQTDAPTTKSASPSDKVNDNENTETPDTSSLYTSGSENGRISAAGVVPKDAGSSSGRADKLQPRTLSEVQGVVVVNEKIEIIEQKTSKLPRSPSSSSSQAEKLQSVPGKVVVSEKIEITKQKTFKLPTDSEGCVPSSQQNAVGDDFSRKEEVNIACECEPTVAGGAVPTVKSFIPIEDQNSPSRCNRSHCSQSAAEQMEHDDQRSGTCETMLHKCKEKARPVSKIALLIKDGDRDKERLSSDVTRKKVTSSPQDSKTLLKKPSLIPKLMKVNSSSSRLDKDETEKRESPTQLRARSDLFQPLSSNTAKTKEIKPLNVLTPTGIPKSASLMSDRHVANSDAPPYVNSISSRMSGLQERLKATTSMLREKIDTDRYKDKTSSEEDSIDLTIEEHTDSPSPNNNMNDLYKSISSLKEAASALSENNTLKGQTRYIEKLFLNISEIKLIADRLCMSDSDLDLQGGNNDDVAEEKEKSPKPSVTNAKDNKIYIKFIQAKDRKSDSKKKMKESSPDQGDEPQNDLALGSKLPSDSETYVGEKNLEDDKVKEADSMDGVFIPSCEPPRNLEDEEETNGLDITITFPEFSHLYSNCSESHLSVCLSDISAEALKKLKRCPKDFTLRMDFVEGKVLFQSGKGPANNFQIGPDLKFSENVIDTKKSDVISIKPSTECSFGSQLIPVDSPKEVKSFKSLRSTDSEVFNVVSLPFLYTNHYLATSHKSCITFRNEQIMSMAILAKHIFKSMPQIPSLTNIFEDRFMEGPSKTDPRKKAQKSIESEKMDS